MRSIIFTLGTILLIAVVFVSASEKGDVEKTYYQCISQYFEVSIDSIAAVSKAGVVDPEIPVIFFLAKKSKVEPSRIANLRVEGNSLAEIAKSRTVSPEALYFMITGEITSKTYQPIFAKLGNPPAKTWDKTELTDSDIINIVNLKMIYSNHDYSVFKVMAMRDMGKDFIHINDQVGAIKKEMNKKKKAKKEADKQEDKEAVKEEKTGE